MKNPKNIDIASLIKKCPNMASNVNHTNVIGANYDNLHIQYTYLITLCNSCSFMCYFNFFNKSGNSLNSKMR